MTIRASGPPFANLCKCGWKEASECRSRPEHCGLVLGMPEYNREEVLSEEHTPYEFLEGAIFGASSVSKDDVVQAQVDLNKVCREVVEDLVKESKSTQIGGTHYAEMSVQPWDFMKSCMSPEEYIGYHIGSVIGYLSRHKKKGGQVDIDKALHHMKELSRYLKEDAEYPW